MEYPRRPSLSALFVLSLVLASGLVATALVASAMAQVTSNPDRSWSRRVLPASDGLLGLRYGMDRRTAEAQLRERGLKGVQASRESQLRFHGDVLGESADVVLSFLAADRHGGGDRLARIEVRWRYDGALRAPRRIFESLEELLDRRYGAAVSREQGAWSAISTGAGRRGSVHVGPETEAVLEIRGVRKDLYRVELRLEFPPWAAQL